MIDTIALTLNQENFQILDPDKFKPSARFILSANPLSTFGVNAKQNPKKKELIAGTYKPKLTLYNKFNVFGRKETQLRIELSLPKLLFGNNFSELKYKDFAALTKKLVATLQLMGVLTSEHEIAHAAVSGIHYSKNIIFTDGSIPYHYINKIKEANVKLSLDVNQTDYRNDGHSYRWHTNSYEVVFYDKIKDLEKAKQSDKRSIEQDSNLQVNFLKSFQKRKMLEVLRLEVRLNKSQKIKQLFKAINIKADLTFKKLFKPAISKKVLLYYLDLIESRRSALLDFKAPNDKALLTSLIVNNSNLGPKQILQLFGLKKALDIINIRELRSMLSKYNQRSWYRLMSDLNKVNLPVSNSPLLEIKKQLLKFKPITISKI